MDIIIQGGIYGGTLQYAQAYSTLDFVDKVIISTWKNENIPDHISDKIEVIKLEKPEFYSQQDRGQITPITMNLQIVSSREGIKRATSDIVAKTRSDQKISLDSLKKMKEFFYKNSKISRKFVDGSGPKGTVGIIGINSLYPFHSQDHLFWGYREDVNKIFDIPLMPKELHDFDFSRAYRFPIYLGVHYAARFNDRINTYIKEYWDYLSSTGPKTEKRIEALNLSKEMMDDIFKVFPPIDVYWEKFNSGYWYSEYATYGEYYGKEW